MRVATETWDSKDGISRITLPAYTTHVELRGDLTSLAKLKIVHPLDGDELGIKLWGLGSRPIPNLRVPRLTKLMLPGLLRANLTVVPKYYRTLKELSLWGSPGTLEQVSALGRLSDLERLLMVDLFGFDAGEFPGPERLPKLQALILKSVAKDTATALKQRFAGIEQLDILQPRAPDWVAQNVSNPFRAWEGRKNIRTADAKAAFKAHVAAQAALAKLAKGKPKQKDVEAVMKAFVTTLNKAAKKSSLETAERDDAVTAFRSLLARTAIPETRADEWWERWEDF